MTLLGSTLRLLDDDGGTGAGGSRVRFGISQLFDGTVVRRPSQGIAHLREVVAKNPKSAEAWRRLGNTCERYGRSDEAAVAWRKSVEVDPEELEATYSLATLAGERRDITEAFSYLRKALRLLPRNRSMAGQLRRQMAESLVALLQDIVEGTDEPMGMMAGWAAGKSRDEPIVNASTVNLRALTENGWARLPKFLSSADLLALDLTPELPEEEPTILQRTLNQGAGAPLEVERITIAPAPAKRGPRIGPNVPCPCGSGKKYKRCCGR